MAMHCLAWTGCLAWVLLHYGLLSWGKIGFLFIGHWLIEEAHRQGYVTVQEYAKAAGVGRGWASVRLSEACQKGTWERTRLTGRMAYVYRPKAKDKR